MTLEEAKADPMWDCVSVHLDLDRKLHVKTHVLSELVVETEIVPLTKGDFLLQIQKSREGEDRAVLDEIYRLKVDEFVQTHCL